jgi:hypothetical protein
LDTERPLSSSIHADEPERVTDPGRSPGIGRPGGFEGAPVNDDDGLTTGVAVGGVALAGAFGVADEPGARTTTRIAVPTTMATIASMARDATPRGTDRGRQAARIGATSREPASFNSCSK